MLRLAAALVLLAGCAGETGGEAQEQDLIGGELAEEGDLPSVVYLPSGCTAAAVGPRHLLTAAHCVLSSSNSLNSAYEPSQVIKLSRGSAPIAEVVVERTHVSTSWFGVCERAYCAISSVAGEQDAADVALIVVQDELPIPVTPVDLRPVEPGEAVVIAGYGCEQGIQVVEPGREPTLRFADTEALDAEDALHDGSFMSEPKLPNMDGNYLLTPGPGAAVLAGDSEAEDFAAGLCPGDSGGPLFRREGDELRVVGVNANYTLLPEASDPWGLPVTNWHTRIGESARHGIGAWLTELGVSTTRSEALPVEEPTEDLQWPGFAWWGDL